MRWQLSASYSVENQFRLYLSLCKGKLTSTFNSEKEKTLQRRHYHVPRNLESEGITQVSLCLLAYLAK